MVPLLLSSGDLAMPSPPPVNTGNRAGGLQSSLKPRADRHFLSLLGCGSTQMGVSLVVWPQGPLQGAPGGIWKILYSYLFGKMISNALVCWKGRVGRDYLPLKSIYIDLIQISKWYLFLLIDFLTIYFSNAKVVHGKVGQ